MSMYVYTHGYKCISMSVGEHRHNVYVFLYINVCIYSSIKMIGEQVREVGRF